MSQVYHRLYRTRLARGYWRDRERPVLLNNWEATYMNFNEEKILSIARKAKETGVELFVLDDGWFGDRSDDDRSLGDWYVNKEKLPGGISGLSEKIEAMGLSLVYGLNLRWSIKTADSMRPIQTGLYPLQDVMKHPADSSMSWIFPEVKLWIPLPDAKRCDRRRKNILY